MGWMREGNNLRGLQDFCNDLPENIDMVEVGTFEGDSAKIFLDSGKVRSLLCVDPYMDGVENYPLALQQAEMNFKSQVLEKYSNVAHMRTTSEEAAQRFMMNDIKFDLVYIDADHSQAAVSKDLSLWVPLVRKGGIIAGHDYDHAHPGVMIAVDEILGVPVRRYADMTWMHRV